jgi:hypothetical protein
MCPERTRAAYPRRRPNLGAAGRRPRRPGAPRKRTSAATIAPFGAPQVGFEGGRLREVEPGRALRAVDHLSSFEVPLVDMDLNEPLMTAAQVARLLAVPTSSVYEYARWRAAPPALHHHKQAPTLLPERRRGLATRPTDLTESSPSRPPPRVACVASGSACAQQSSGLATASACRRSHISSEPVASRALSRPGRSLHSSRRSSLNQRSLVVQLESVERNGRRTRSGTNAVVSVSSSGRHDSPPVCEPVIGPSRIGRGPENGPEPDARWRREREAARLLRFELSCQAGAEVGAAGAGERLGEAELEEGGEAVGDVRSSSTMGPF